MVNRTHWTWAGARL